MVSWCDKLASTPTVGLELDPHYAASESLVTAISPLLDDWGDEFSIAHQEVFLLHIQHNNGFLYVLEPKKLTIRFQHRLKVRPVSGGMPVAELISEAMPFTKLLERAIEELTTVAPLLPQASRRRAHRVGIVATTRVEESDQPPGIHKLVNFLSAPWGGELDSFRISATAKIEETEHYRNRCIHTATRPDDPNELSMVSFDFQRYPSTPIELKRNSLQRECARCRESALAYFERLAVGDAFDERVNTWTGR